MTLISTHVNITFRNKVQLSKFKAMRINLDHDYFIVFIIMSLAECWLRLWSYSNFVHVTCLSCTNFEIRSMHVEDPSVYNLWACVYKLDIFLYCFIFKYIRLKYLCFSVCFVLFFVVVFFCSCVKELKNCYSFHSF